ncbi:MAG: site-2 protease family protein, partial [Candidatus Altiarchaeota archaeon]|nr:site-2 protease family protein [Candidatus Altiarchaeota archaeon]
GWLSIFAWYFLFIGLGFVVHESSHKFMAVSLGAQSEFRMWSQGLWFAIIMRAIGGPIFIAPGATYWSKYGATREDHGKVSVAGPLSNFVLAGIFWMAAWFFPIMGIGARINLQLAMFNLIPMPPLDGSKIITWKPILWGFLFGASIILQRFIVIG